MTLSKVRGRSSSLSLSLSFFIADINDFIRVTHRLESSVRSTSASTSRTTVTGKSYDVEQAISRIFEARPIGSVTFQASLEPSRCYSDCQV